MNKVVTILTAVLIAVFVAVKMSDTPAPGQLDWTDEEVLRERLVNYRCFKRSFEETVESLGKGELNLKEAQARVCAAARRFHPDYLEHITHEEPGARDAERVAQNLVGHLRNRQEFQPRACALEIELHELREEAARQSATEPGSVKAAALEGAEILSRFDNITALSAGRESDVTPIIVVSMLP